MKWLTVWLLGCLWTASTMAETEQPELARCKRIQCDLRCPFGRALDHNGCELCDCKPDPCDNFECKPEERCQLMKECADGKCDQKPMCLPVLKKAKDYIMEPSSKCAVMPMCANRCESGYKNDQNGCMTCTCKDECDAHKCPEGAECQIKTSCQLDECFVNPTCTVTPLCKRTQTEHDLKCDQEGSFLPTQCHSPEGALHRECWCVNDRGLETEGSRTKVQEEDSKPECVYNRTLRIHVQFFMRHDFDQVEVHLGRIKEAVHHHITEWMLVDKEYIINLQVAPHSHQAKLVVVQFEVVRQGRIDLAATAVQLQDHMTHDACHVHLQDNHNLHADPSSLHMDHTYGPEVEPPVQNTWRRRCHRMLFILGPVAGAAIFLLTIILVVGMVNQKRLQRKRMLVLAGKGDAFKQNIAFSNELYDQTQMLDSDTKKVKLEFSSEPVVEAKLTEDV